MSVKLRVLYPSPTDPEQFNRRYEREHLPMGKGDRRDRPRLASHSRVARGQVPVRSTDGGLFSHIEGPAGVCGLPGAQKTLAHAVEISTGGAPHFMIVEQEG